MDFKEIYSDFREFCEKFHSERKSDIRKFCPQFYCVFAAYTNSVLMLQFHLEFLPPYSDIVDMNIIIACAIVSPVVKAEESAFDFLKPQIRGDRRNPQFCLLAAETDKFEILKWLVKEANCPIGEDVFDAAVHSAENTETGFGAL